MQQLSIYSDTIEKERIRRILNRGPVTETILEKEYFPKKYSGAEKSLYKAVNEMEENGELLFIVIANKFDWNDAIVHISLWKHKKLLCQMVRNYLKNNPSHKEVDRSFTFLSGE